MKLAEFQASLKAPKGQFNNFGKYKYRSAEDIIEAVKPLVNPKGFYLTLTDDLVQIGERYYIKCTVVLSDGTETYTSTAFAREEEDKKGMDGSQITGAASSYARKYALNGLFAIDDTKDSDATNDHTEKPEKKEKQKEALTPEHPSWGKVVVFLKGSGTITEVMKKFTLSKEIEAKLIDATLE